MKRKKLTQILTIVLVCSSNPTISFAEPPAKVETDKIDVQMVTIDEVNDRANEMIAELVAKGHLKLRASPPTNTAGWYSMGPEIGTIQSGEPLVVEDKVEVTNFLVNQEWLKVRRLFPRNGPDIGWVYNGGPSYVIRIDIEDDRKPSTGLSLN